MAAKKTVTSFAFIGKDLNQRISKRTFTDTLLGMGHIAVSTDGGSTIRGFTPKVDFSNYDGSLDGRRLLRLLRLTRLFLCRSGKRTLIPSVIEENKG